ncbi:MAG TPA: nuclear transport factor 2 family protein [Candidatus Acidoferrales bacterium]|nr:nuclear transport factor 2 family protein [Candidatus Acidoferrales bacterium]
MKALYATLLGAGALCAALAIAIPTRTMAQDDPALQAADHDFAAAVSKSDKAALDKLLDTDFVWIEANGKLQDHAQVLAGVPKRLIPVLIINGKPQFAPVRWHNYGEVAVAQTDEDRKHLVRIWVKRPAGWRALVYQEVESLGAAPKSTPSAGQQCDNPCKSVGYRPQNETEAAIIKAYERLETSAMTHNAADWDAHTGEEFAAASSFSDKLLDKPTRLGELKRSNMAGLAPTPLVSGKLFVFGDAAVLRSRHQAGQVKLEVTRVWAKRDGRWVETLSYQTGVQSGS